MAKNDTLLLDGILQDRMKNASSNDIGESFELFTLEQILKDYDLSRDDIESGWIDGKNDGGIDAIYVFCNGRLVRDIRTFQWPKHTAALEAIVISCRHRDSFQLEPVCSLHSTITTIFDFSRQTLNRDGYSTELLEARNILRHSYAAVATTAPTINIRIVYASHGDAVADNIKNKADETRLAATEPFSNATSSFEFIGASELIRLYRKQPDFSLPLDTEELLPSKTGNSHIAISKLTSLYRFICDDQGKLRRYLFDSNVRDFMGENPVNSEILSTLKNPTAPEFWWLNNGITILATEAAAIGRQLRLVNVQIVNGLQTSESIYNHFSTGGSQLDERCVLVKILVSEDKAARDQIIKATNSQTPVELLSLRATDKIQRDIEEILERHEWFYERRKNYYKYIGQPESRFVTPVFAGGAFLGVVLHNTAQASRLRSKNLREASVYDRIFSEKTPLAVWPVIVAAAKKSEEFLATVRPNGAPRFFANWRNHVALLMTARILGTFGYNADNVAGINPELYTISAASDAWALIRQAQENLAAKTGKEFAQARLVVILADLAARQWGVRSPEAIAAHAPAMPVLTKKDLPKELVNRVNAALPEQPWPPGIHARIARELNVPTQHVSMVIQHLIASGKRNRQKDGVVFDTAGKAIAFDAARVSKRESGS